MQVLKVPSCVEPPAPKVTEKYSGLKSANSLATDMSFSFSQDQSWEDKTQNLNFLSLFP